VLVGIYFFVAVTGSLLGIKKFEYALLLVPLAVGVLVFHVLVSNALPCLHIQPTQREPAWRQHASHQHCESCRCTNDCVC
jgi:hypothetical protein